MAIVLYKKEFRSALHLTFRLPINPVAQVDMLGQVYVDTTETVSLKYHLNLNNVFEYVSMAIW